MRFVVLVAFAVILAGIGLYPTPSPDGASAGGAAVPSAGGFDKLIGTSTGHYHLSFPDYIQIYDGVSTATVTWEEHPELFDASCHCRVFLPTGGIDWTVQYVTESCSDTVSGHVAAGQGLAAVNEQMLILWEDLNNPDQYLYSGDGTMQGDASIDCDSGFEIEIPDFFHVKRPEKINTATPSPFPAALPAGAPARSCNSEFRVARDASRIADSCYAGDPYNQYDYITYTWDFRLPPEPIVFIHGSMGSRIKCGNSELWPNIPFPKLLQMALAEDGTSPAPGACATASVGKILDAVPGKQIYKPTVDFLEGLEPDVSFFNWDWRKGPQQSLAALDNHIAGVRASHDNAKVVIMAHSYGGLLARLYVDNSGRADNVARVLTVGTPAWGSPKALFPLYAGIETPELSFLDAVLDNDDLHELARNLMGVYFLYPSASYGSWLTVSPASSALSPQGLLTYVSQLGGNAVLLGQALSLHASTLDAPYIVGPSGPRFEVIVGTGLPTITSIEVRPRGRLRIRHGNGDGTVPANSAARGAVGPGNPNHDHIHYACDVDHVDLPGDSQVTDAIRDFLLFGDDIKTMRGPCPFTGDEWELYKLAPISASTGPAGVEPNTPAGAMSIEDAVLQGVVDYLDLPDQKIVITGEDFPPVALPAAKFLQVTPLSEDGKGQPTIYGPLNGQTTISKDAGGRVVLVDGEPAPLHGDVNCDKAVTALDALLLVLHAGETPISQTAGCAAIGSGADPFGDVDCDNSITAMDALADLQIVANVSLAFIAGCQ